MHVKGIHHVSALTADAQENYRFYTEVIGMRLVKKTVNQDDTSVYHLFYGDEKGNPGTELTFFEIPMAAKAHRGVSSISSIGLRVKDDEALSYWEKRLDDHGVTHDGIVTRSGRKYLDFEDPEGQRLSFVSDQNNEGVSAGTPWEFSPVSREEGAGGLGPIRLTVRKPEGTVRVLTEILGFRETDRSYAPQIDGQPEIRVFESGLGGNGAEVHLEGRTDLPPERMGRGAVHHVAFRVDDEEELRQWVEKINELQIPNSGFVDRFYFRSLYFREPNGILFELATDGPGFDTDESLDSLGESLALPPFFENRREEIEAKLKPLDTKRK
ncbi:ring-cleaving dioxygenase [Alteribacter natronophilus]|uniref:ring-cleaving dioxygenase n=1 Tax=Alteribacter natronophilus TaxID=2583810 RepID=UPI00110EE58A|nr:ring-cleaving dioxygenase [Alteribacter natronophilus]TMW73450.1 ring-cleaving dioxygenase [Alteribacter natronophilus]